MGAVIFVLMKGMSFSAISFTLEFAGWAASTTLHGLTIIIRPFEGANICVALYGLATLQSSRPAINVRDNGSAGSAGAAVHNRRKRELLLQLRVAEV
jgi:hypothetical protein